MQLCTTPHGADFDKVSGLSGVSILIFASSESLN